jgi:secreted trypsin-like serine protease
MQSSYRWLVCASAGVTIALTGCAADAEDFDESSDEIIGGAAETKRENVVNVTTATGGRCSGTLIAPAVVLTAAHCVDKGGKGNVQVAFGSDADKPDEKIDVRAFHIHPKWKGSSVSLGDGVDVAVLLLEKPSSVTPALLNRSGLKTTYAGKSVTLVGFGRDGSGDSGIKRSVVATVTKVAEREFSMGKTGRMVCKGDSGGPTFSTISGKLLGVHSYVDKFENETCLGSGSDTRVDKVLDFIDPFLRVN